MNQNLLLALIFLAGLVALSVITIAAIFLIIVPLIYAATQRLRL